ncbi:MAG: polysaccharide deacetylase family protein, partial [Pirellulaceae bacterium]
MFQAARPCPELLARCLLLMPALLITTDSLAQDANRLAYLDTFLDPYYVSGDFPKLTTPQWVGEAGVEAVVVLAIDDMRDPARYETYLRPILERLKQIDGRAPVSIMTNQVRPDDPLLAKWLKEGLSIDVHTINHPCPCLQKSDLPQAKRTYHQCVDLMASIPGNRPVAFRMPCCDSLNTPSPRFWTEIFNRTSAKGNFLSIDSSVFNVITPADKALPRKWVLRKDGNERFRHYIPFKSFVNTIDDYPYPYLIGRSCWEFPCVVPSDWAAQHVQRSNNPETVRDMKIALDVTVKKQGVYNLVFHPHGWIRNDQVIEIIDHAVEKYGNKVKFLTFREAADRLQKHLLSGQPLRAADGSENG